MHETDPLKPAEPKSTLLACTLARWFRSVITHPRKAQRNYTIVLKRRISVSRLGLQMAPGVSSRRPRNKSSPASVR